ncbi:diaminobutyrate decarboxylase [Actinomadura sp. KC216]|uniref:pyridoxal phosphate-dependent decarboxylase family protein n=1 Tax=Actinomadura sp. KC216 TaxID=2530370 RepID=UPI00104C288B|nr:pyridoxal-dependent decarboxylase [Actinomadura sp. KC216]TDB91208.1 diaminobutyrate decarboxylase [Actinomadura sp. KC216]
MDETASPENSWDMAEFERSSQALIRHLHAYVAGAQSGEGPVARRRPPHQVRNRLKLDRWIRDGGMNTTAFEEFLDGYLDEGTRLHHPGYLSHQCAVPDVPAALADLVHGTTNNAMSLYEMGAAGATVELAVIDWMLEKVGWSAQHATGVLVHGGSLANLTALLAARARALPCAWRAGMPSGAVILAPPSSHLSVPRAAAILGLGTDGVIEMPSDRLGRIVADQLPSMIRKIRDSERVILAIVANACAPATGLYDDLNAIARVCRDERIWLHVDAAHGGSALLVPELKHLMNGIQGADSIVWDAHKMLRTSTLAAAVLARDATDLASAFQQHADYLFFDDDRAGPDLMTRTVEGAKAELGLKLFLNLAWRGEDGLGRYVAGRHAIARRLWELLRTQPNFQVLCEPESNVVCFRYGRDDHDQQHLDRLQITLRDRLLDDGLFHLASSVVDGRRWLRATVMAPSTNEPTLRSLLDTVQRYAAESASTGPSAISPHSANDHRCSP